MSATKKLRANTKAHVAGLVASKKEGVRFSRRQLDQVDVAELEKLAAGELWRQSDTVPVMMPGFLPVWDGKKDHWRAYLYQDAFWANNLAHSDEEMKLLVKEAADAEKRKFDQLQRKFAEGAELPLS